MLARFRVKRLLQHDPYITKLTVDACASSNGDHPFAIYSREIEHALSASAIDREVSNTEGKLGSRS